MGSKNFYSQFGEDKELAAIFHGKAQGLCVEVGANDGVNDSTTYHFERSGWTCVLVEPNPELCREIRKTRTSPLFDCAASDEAGTITLHIAEGADRAHGVSTVRSDQESLDRIKKYGFATRPVEVKARTLDEILAEAKVRAPIDFISIDVEGHELAVLKGFSLDRWVPTILLLEDNSNYEDAQVSDYLEKRGYVRFKRTGVNDWYALGTNRELATPANRLRYAFGAIKTKCYQRVRRVPGVVPAGRMLKRAVGL